MRREDIMGRITEEEVQNMSIEELLKKLEEVGWERADFFFLGDDDSIVVSKEFNINDYEGIGKFLFTIDPESDDRNDIIEDPMYMIYEIDLQEKSAMHYFLGLDDNIHYVKTHYDFDGDQEAFNSVVAKILNNEFLIKRETPFGNIWEPIRETYNEEIIPNQYLIRNYYLTLARAKENWTGYVMDAEEETNIKQGDYVVIAKDNLERRPKTYYLISEKEAEMILDAKNNAEAFAIMNHIIQEKTAEHDQLFEDYER